MTAKVRIPAPFQDLTQNLGLVEAEGATIKEVLADLENRYPGFRDRVYNDKGDLYSHISIYVNGEDIRFLEGEQTLIAEGNEIALIPAIAGGRTN